MIKIIYREYHELGFFVPTREEKWPGKIEHSAAAKQCNWVCTRTQIVS
jgi:hypothetical protein